MNLNLTIKEIRLNNQINFDRIVETPYKNNKIKDMFSIVEQES